MTSSAQPSASAAHALPDWLAGFVRRWPALSARYLSLDPRSLGLCRIYLGCLLLVDLLRRVDGLRVWYTNQGVLPNHTLLWRPAAEYQFSLFFLASHAGEAAFLFVLCGIVYALFALGYRTKLMHVLSCVAVCSLHNRLSLLEDGSEVTTRLLTFWTVFLPMGARFSLDALRTPGPVERRPAVSLAVLAILLQVSLLYVFNVLHKSGETWRSGTAVHYVLHQDRIVTWLGWKVRALITPAASQWLTYLTIVVEAALPILIWCPIGWKLTRRVAIVLAIGLHLSFAALLNIAMFSYNMVGFFLLLLTDRDWEWLERVPHAFSAAVERGARRGLARLGLGDLPAPRTFPRLRELVVVLFMIATGSQMLLENDAVPKALRVRRQPLWMHLMVEYPRLLEGWSMFAPEVPTQDAFVYVDALTADGRQVDPINELTSRVASLPVSAIPERLGMDANWCDYTARVVESEEYQPALADFIRNYHRRTRRANDRIVSFKVWKMEDDSPPPGSQQPTNVRQRLLFEEPAR